MNTYLTYIIIINFSDNFSDAIEKYIIDNIINMKELQLSDIFDKKKFGSVYHWENIAKHFNIHSSKCIEYWVDIIRFKRNEIVKKHYFLSPIMLGLKNMNHYLFFKKHLIKSKLSSDDIINVNNYISKSFNSRLCCTQTYNFDYKLSNKIQDYFDRDKSTFNNIMIEGKIKKLNEQEWDSIKSDWENFLFHNGLQFYNVLRIYVQGSEIHLPNEIKIDNIDKSLKEPTILDLDLLMNDHNYGFCFLHNDWQVLFATPNKKNCDNIFEKNKVIYFLLFCMTRL